MKANSESTFGTKLANALQLAGMLAGFNNYKAPRETETLEQYQ